MPARRGKPSSPAPPKPSRGAAKGPTREALLAALAERERELAEAREQQAAVAEVLEVISRSAFDLQAVLDTLMATAARLCDIDIGGLTIRDGEVFRYAALHGVSGEFGAALLARSIVPGRDTMPGRVALEGKVVQVEDLAADADYAWPVSMKLGIRTILGVPMLREGKVVGTITFSRRRVAPFTERQVELIRTFADQAAIAIENARLLDETREALERQTATADILKVIASSPSDVQPVFQAIAESAKRLLGGYSGVVVLYAGDWTHLAAFTSISPEADAAAKAMWPQHRPPTDPIIEALRRHGFAEISDTEAELERIDRDQARARGYRSILAVALTVDGELFGAIAVTRKEPGRFAPHHIELLQTFADQAVIAIRNTRLFNETREALERQTATADILKVIASSPSDVQPVFEAIAASANRLLGGFSTVVFRFLGEALHLAAFTPTNAAADKALQAAFPRPIAELPDVQSIRDGQTEQFVDTEAESGIPPMVRDIARARGYRSMLFTPLMSNNGAIGFISVTRKEPGTFAPHHIQLLQTFADQAVIAIENVGLFNAVQARTRDLAEALRFQTATSEVLKVISQSPNSLEPVLDVIVETSRQLCAAETSTVWMLAEGKYRLTAASGSAERLDYHEYLRANPLTPDQRGSSTARAARETRTVHIPDIVRDPEYGEGPMGLGERRALLSVPLMRGGTAVGVITLLRTHDQPFTARQIEAVETFADQAVIAVQNVRLFEEVQARTRDLSESLQQQTATADVLKVISRSAFDLDAVFDALLASAVSLIGGRGGTICVRDGDVFRYRAVAEGRDSAMWRYLSEHPATPGQASVAGRVLLSGKPETVRDTLLDSDLKVPVHALAGARSIVCVPLLRDGRVDGALMVGRFEAGPFDSRQIELLQTFADQAVIAIENVRLFDEVQAGTRDLSEALQQQTATADVLKAISRTAFDLDTVLETLIATATRLCDAKYGQIFRRQGDVFRYAASQMDVDPAYLQHEQTTEIQPGRGTLVGRVALEKRTVEIADAWNDPEYGEKQEARLGNVRAMLGVPLMRDGEPIGAFALARGEPIPFTRRQVELVTTFADQAVIAIENVRLFDEVQARTRDLQESLQQQTATADVLKVISRSAFDLQTVLHTLVESAAKLCDANGAVITREVDGVLYRAESYGRSEEFMAAIRRLPVVPERGTVSGRVLLEGKPVQIDDIEADPEYTLKAYAKMGAFRTVLGIPMLRDGAPIGVISLLRPEVRAFSDKQIELAQTFADQAVIAIENARLFDEVQAKTRDLSESLQQQTATANVLQVISRSAFDLNLAMSTILKAAAELCRAPLATLHLRDGEVCRLATQFGFSEAFVRQAREVPVPVRYPLHARRHARAGDVAHFTDAQNDPDYLYKTAARLGGYRAIVVIPLMREDELIGIFSLGRPEPEPFTPSQIKLVQTFADQAAIAIENARLFNETQEALEQQKASGEVLSAISSSVSDAAPVFDRILDGCERMVTFDRAAIFLVDADGQVSHAATRDRMTAVLPGALFSLFPQPVARTPMQRAFEEGRVVIFSDIASDPEAPWTLREAVKHLGNFSVVVAPMLWEGRGIGAIHLSRAGNATFTEKEVALLKTFADQAVIAIQNARLFRETQEALQQQTATAEVLKVISRSAFDLQVVFDTLLKSVVHLLGAIAGVIAVREGDQIRFKSSVSPDSDLPRQLTGRLIALDRSTTTGRAMASGRIEYIPDADADPDYQRLPISMQGRSYLAVPLSRDERVEGALTLVAAEPNAFTQRHIELAQTFADQAAIAIENVRLFDEVQARTKELAASLDDLRKAQDRLIQSEKLASLGQLTAGIAHEIKNPLNFVNNFSVLSRELIDELGEALTGAPLEEAQRRQADSLIGMVGANLDKVVHHGKRADSIVKNMLLHSREGSGERSSVNINAMVEEALNLAYHGARAERPDFNVTIAKSLDAEAGAADLYAQEMTRVLLNLISNGFYATRERKQGGANRAYEPTISASTRDLGHSVEIAIRDNGTGIPDEVRAKMFNPFFTTKPVGEGTGLGLSLSHDIVVKQHGGTLEVSSEPGSHTQFTIVVPRAAPAAAEKAGAPA